MSLVYYILDVETTGLDVTRHEITQVSFIRCEDRHQLSKYIKAEYPERATPKALEITGRTINDILKGDTKNEVVEAVERFILSDQATPEHRCIIGHNISFDRRFCHALWQSLGKMFPANLWLCTKTCTKDYAKNVLGIPKPKLTLAASLQLCGLKPKELHNAKTDTQSTYILYHFLKKNEFDFLKHIKRIEHINETLVGEEETE